MAHPDHIPRIEIALTLGNAECAQCGGKLRRLGEDVTEELEYVPGPSPLSPAARHCPRTNGGQWLDVVTRIVRPRMACSGCDCFTQAPLPSRPIERGRPGPGLLAHVLVNKYADHLPLYRQSQIFDREGLDLDRSTLADWSGQIHRIAGAAGSCHPLPGRRLQSNLPRGRRHVLAGQAIFADDTPVAMLAPGTGKTQTARLWACGRDERPWGSSIPPASLAIALGPMADNGSVSGLVRPQRPASQRSPVQIFRLDARRRLRRV